VDRVNSYICQCTLGFSGEHCEININDCKSNSCSLHGACHDGENTYTCMCDTGYTGINCQVKLQPGAAYVTDDALSSRFLNISTTLSSTPNNSTSRDSAIPPAAVIVPAIVGMLILTMLMIWLGKYILHQEVSGVLPFPALDLLEERVGVGPSEEEQFALALQASISMAAHATETAESVLNSPPNSSTGLPNVVTHCENPSSTPASIPHTGSNDLVSSSQLAKAELEKVVTLRQEWHVQSDLLTSAQVAPFDDYGGSSLDFRGTCGGCGQPVLSTQERNKDEVSGIYFHAKCTNMLPLVQAQAVDADSMAQEDLIKLMLLQNN
jgi:hypothetical protein